MPFDPTGHFVTVGGKSYEITVRPEDSEFGARFWWVFDGSQFHRLRERRADEIKPNGLADIDREARQWIMKRQLTEQLGSNASQAESAQCECGAVANYALSKWPPKVDRERRELMIPFVCPNGHEFLKAIRLK